MCVCDDVRFGPCLFFVFDELLTRSGMIVESILNQALFILLNAVILLHKSVV